MVLFLALFATLTGLAVVLTAALLPRAPSAAPRLAAVSLTAGGLLLAGGGAWKSWRQLHEPTPARDVVNDLLAELYQPSAALWLHVAGTDPFADAAQGWALQLWATTLSGADFVAAIPVELLTPVDDAPGPGRTYALAWQALVDGVENPEARALAAEVASAFALLGLASVQLIVVGPRAETDAFPDGLTLTPAGAPDQRLYSGRRAPGAPAGEGVEAVATYPAEHTPSYQMEQLQAARLGGLDAFDFRLRWLFALVGVLLVVGAAGRFLHDPGAADGPTPGRAATGLLMLTTLGMALAGTLFGEKILVGGGFGWDGGVYGAWAMNFHAHVVETGVEAYYLQRVLPAAVVHYGLRLCAVPLTSVNVIYGFGLLNVLLLVVATALAVYLFLFAQAFRGPSEVPFSFASWLSDLGIVSGDATALTVELLALSAPLVALYVFLARRGLWGRTTWPGPAALWDRPTLLRLLAAAVFLVALKLVQHWCAQSPHDDGGVKVLPVLTMMLCESIKRPGVFYLCHVLFFGPVLLLALFHWPAICRAVQDRGAGLVLAVTFGVLLALDSESRHLINFAPLLVPFVVAAAAGPSWRPAQGWAFVALTLLASRLWLRLPDVPEAEAPLRFPSQAFFMTFGPLMSRPAYLVQGGLVLLAAFVVYLFLAPARSQPAGRAADTA